MNAFQLFFIKCAGSSLSILKRCPTDITKHVGVGATVFFTGLLASLSGGFAIYTIFDKIWVAILFGILWGLMIFNLDRLIVSSFRFKKDGASKWKLSLPRIALAAILAVVIAKPLELKIFEKEINKEFALMHAEELKTYEDNLGSLHTSEEQELQNLKKELQQNITIKDSIYQQRQLELDMERLGKSSSRTSGNAGYGPLAKEKEKQAKDALSERDQAQLIARSRIDSINTALSLIVEKRKGEFEKNKSKITGYEGLAAQLHAMKRLGEKEPVVKWASYAVFLLFFIIEITPILAKLLSPRGPYDLVLMNHEHDFEVNVLRKMEQKNYGLNADLERYKSLNNKVSTIKN